MEGSSCLCDDFSARATAPRGISPDRRNLAETTPARQFCTHNRHNAVDTITPQTCCRLFAKMPTALLVGRAETECASNASASPPHPILNLLQTIPCSNSSKPAVQRVLHRPLPSLSQRARPAKLASTAQHSPARWSSRSGGPSSSAKYTAAGKRAMSTRRRICRAPSRRSGRRDARSRRVTLSTCWVSILWPSTRWVAEGLERLLRD